ncbi:MAG TPA: putative zinc-binding metallopeptidase, partial [Ideonella sp.]|nr:putative zinc-binding metallopeptidase [Ideonella sp.]
FFRNSACLACGSALGYDPQRQALLPIEPDGGAWWKAADGTPGRYRRCAELETASGCNWLLGEDEPRSGTSWQCRCCRLLRTRPDLSLAGNGAHFNKIELARRRLVSALLGLGLPVRSRVFEDPAQGLAFDVLRADPGGPPVITGHADGLITLDLEEADDALREQRRATLNEPYRTLLGHLRHESGHYYWQRLVEPDAACLAAWRERFGDERADYRAALQAYHAQGAPADWNTRHVSAYASAHPWEDWAETWAHYLHLSDTLDTARSFGLDGAGVELGYEPFEASVLGEDAADAQPFLALIRAWMELTGVLNELSRSMGVNDFYPFVLSAEAVRKLHFVHRVVTQAPG